MKREQMARQKRTRGEGAIKFRCSFKNTIYDVMKNRGWKETDSETDWDFQWTERDMVFDVFDNSHMEHWQRMNHFRNGREVRKPVPGRRRAMAKHALAVCSSVERIC